MNGDLASISSYAEQMTIIANEPKRTVYWIGLKRTNGKWTWVDGTSSSWRHWWYGSPDSHPEGGCAVIDNNGSKETGWSNSRCKMSWGYICEYKGNKLTLFLYLGYFGGTEID